MNIMWITFTLNQKKHQSSDQGFITLEIIIALLIAFGFLMVSLQTLVLAMVFKVEAQEEQRANKLIQEDIERINDLGSALPIAAIIDDEDRISACDGDLDDNGTADDGYSQNLWAALQADTPDGSTDLQATLLSNGGKTVTLTRTPQLNIPTSGSPNRILGISYRVADENGTVVANRYVEVIPDAALECP